MKLYNMQLSVTGFYQHDSVEIHYIALCVPTVYSFLSLNNILHKYQGLTDCTTGAPIPEWNSIV